MRREVREEPDLRGVAREWEVSPVGEQESRHERKIHSIPNVPLMRDCQTSVINYLEEPVLVEGTITALTGVAGCGKSTLVCAIARRLHITGRPILILDRENPKVVVEERFRRLAMSDDETFHVWGGWTGQEAPQPASAIVLEWVIQCEQKPLIIVDSLSAFYKGDQNDASEMRGWMNQCRQLTDLGATAAVLHHDGKAETAKDYRGSSDFAAAVDIGFHVTNVSDNGHLGKLVLRCFKSRFGFAGSVIYTYTNGQLLQAQEPEAVTRTVTEQFTALLRLNPGINGKKFESLASERKLGRNRARAFLNAGVLANTIQREVNGSNVHFSLRADGRE
jgi:energy-coupling factor transporter ATP-binding protein EcfA2